MNTVALVACCKTKRAVPSTARTLYRSPLFLGMRRYAETHADGWFILSAKYGLVEPSERIEPYELSLPMLSAPARAAWSYRIMSQVFGMVPVNSHILMLAGTDYRNPLKLLLERRGYSVAVPFAGLSIGQQLHALKEGRAAVRVAGE